MACKPMQDKMNELTNLLVLACNRMTRKQRLEVEGLEQWFEKHQEQLLELKRKQKDIAKRKEYEKKVEEYGKHLAESMGMVVLEDEECLDDEEDEDEE